MPQLIQMQNVPAVARQSSVRRSCHILLVLSSLLLGGCRDIAESISQQTEQAKESRELLEIRAVFDSGDTETATTRLLTHIESHPNSATAWAMLGNCYERQDQAPQAHSAYRKALSLEPKMVEALTGLGILCRKSGEYAKGLEYYKQAIELEPNYAQAYSSMAVIELKLENDSSALRYAKKAYELDDTDPVIAANLAVMYHYNDDVPNRDRMAGVASSLGYHNMESLRTIFSGEMTVRD